MMAEKGRRVRHRAHLPERSYGLELFDDPSVLEHFEIFEAIFSNVARFTLLPEILRIFGPEEVLRFLDLFKGTKVDVPAPEVLHEIARDTVIYVHMAAGDSEDELRYLESRYELSRQHLKSIYKRVKRWLDERNPPGPDPSDPDT
jgi:hypothetical protein